MNDRMRRKGARLRRLGAAVACVLEFLQPGSLSAGAPAPDAIVARCGDVRLTAQETLRALLAITAGEELALEDLTLRDRTDVVEAALAEKLQLAELERLGFDRNPWLQPLLINYLMRHGISRSGPRSAGGAGAGTAIDEVPEIDAELGDSAAARAMPRPSRRGQARTQRGELASALRRTSSIQRFEDRLEAYARRRQNGAPWDVRVLPDPLPEQDVVASIDGVPVSVQELEIGLLRTGIRRKPNTRPDAPALHAALDLAIDYRLLAREALRRGAAGDPRIRAAIERKLQQRGLFAGWIEPDISEAELRAYFLAHPDEFAVPDRVMLMRWVVPIPPGGDAEAVRAVAETLRQQLLAAPRDARGHPQPTGLDPTVMRGKVWVLARNARARLEPGVQDQLLNLEPGAVGPVVRLERAWAVPVGLARQPGTTRTFEQSRALVFQRLLARRRLLLTRLHLRELQLSLGVWIDEPLLASLEPPSAPPPRSALSAPPLAGDRPPPSPPGDAPPVPGTDDGSPAPPAQPGGPG